MLRSYTIIRIRHGSTRNSVEPLASVSPFFRPETPADDGVALTASRHHAAPHRVSINLGPTKRRRTFHVSARLGFASHNQTRIYAEAESRKSCVTRKTAVVAVSILLLVVDVPHHVNQMAFQRLARPRVALGFNNDTRHNA